MDSDRVVVVRGKVQTTRWCVVRRASARLICERDVASPRAALHPHCDRLQSRIYSANGRRVIADARAWMFGSVIGTGWTTDLTPGIVFPICAPDATFGCDHHHLRSPQFYILSVYTTRNDELERQGLRRRAMAQNSLAALLYPSAVDILHHAGPPARGHSRLRGSVRRNVHAL